MKKKFESFVKKMSEELNENSISDSQGFEVIPDNLALGIIGGSASAVNTSCNCSSGGTNTSCNCSA